VTGVTGFIFIDYFLNASALQKKWENSNIKWIDKTKDIRYNIN